MTGGAKLNQSNPKFDPRRLETPWMGLQSYDVSDLGYFFGRDKEIQDLAHRVSSRHLTVLYGQSGLGKTSLIRAGLMPRTVELGFIPIYIRLRFDSSYPELESQVKQELFGKLRELNFQMPNVDSALDESIGLWQLFHDPHFGLISSSGNPEFRVLLIFDQFEEVGTLGKLNRPEDAAAFMHSLACLIENRVPLSLEVQLESNDELADRMQLSAHPVHSLLSLRNDYLHWLERYRQVMPSMMDCRMELSTLSGSQALQAVTGPGKLRVQFGKSTLPIVDDETGRAIVKYVAGPKNKKTLNESDSTPPILSLLCERLNAQRIAKDRSSDKGSSQVTIDEFRENADDVLRDFYLNAFRPSYPASVRTILEDKFVTDEGNRDDVASDVFERELRSSGVSQPEKIIEELVNYRLLTREFRNGKPRVELTHDVLLPFVIQYRKSRHEQQEVLRRKVEEAAKRLAYVKRLAVASLLIGLTVSTVLGITAWKQRKVAIESFRTVLSQKKEVETLQGDLAAKITEFSNISEHTGNRAWSEYSTFSGEVGPIQNRDKWHESLANWGRSIELIPDPTQVDSGAVRRLLAIARSTSIAAIPLREIPANVDEFQLSRDKKYLLCQHSGKMTLRSSDDIAKQRSIISGEFIHAEFSPSSKGFYLLDNGFRLTVYDLNGESMAAIQLPVDKMQKLGEAVDNQESNPEELERTLAALAYLDDRHIAIQFADGQAAVWDIGKESLGAFFPCVCLLDGRVVIRDKSRFVSLEQIDDVQRVVTRSIRDGRLAGKPILEVNSNVSFIRQVIVHPVRDSLVLASDQPLVASPEAAPAPAPAPAANERKASSIRYVSTHSKLEPQGTGEKTTTFLSMVELTATNGIHPITQLHTNPFPAIIPSFDFSEDGKWIVAAVSKMAPAGCGAAVVESTPGCSNCGSVIDGGSISSPAPAAPAPAAPAPAPAAPTASLRKTADNDRNPRYVSTVGMSASAVTSTAIEGTRTQTAAGKMQASILFLLDLRIDNALKAYPIRFENEARSDLVDNDNLFVIDATQTLRCWNLPTMQEIRVATEVGAIRAVDSLDSNRLLMQTSDGRLIEAKAMREVQNYRAIPLDGRLVGLRKYSPKSLGAIAIVSKGARGESLEIFEVNQGQSRLLSTIANASLTRTIGVLNDARCRIPFIVPKSSDYETIIWEPTGAKRSILSKAAHTVWLKPDSEIGMPSTPFDLVLANGNSDTFQASSARYVDASPDGRWIVIGTTEVKEEAFSVQVPITVTETIQTNAGPRQVTKVRSLTEWRTRTVNGQKFLHDDQVVSEPSTWTDTTVAALGFSPNNRDMMIARVSGDVEFWNLQESVDNPQAQSSRRIQLPSRLSNWAFNEDGTRLLVTFSYDPSGTMDHSYSLIQSAEVWDLSTPEPRKLMGVEDVTYASLSPDGKHLLTQDKKRIARLFDVGSGQSDVAPIQLPDQILGAIFDSEAKQLIVGTERTVICWTPTRFTQSEIPRGLKRDSLASYARAISGLYFDRETGELKANSKLTSPEEWSNIESFLDSLRR